MPVSALSPPVAWWVPCAGGVIGGILGRIMMRLIFLVDTSKDGASTDFGTAGQVTVGGSFTLLMLCLVTGTIGGALYVGLRRWLPGSSAAARGAWFGLLMTAGPGAVFLGELDLQIFEPAVLIFLAFAALFVLYGVLVARFTDHMHPPRSVLSDRHAGPTKWVVRAVVVTLVVWVALIIGGVQDDAGTCLTGDGAGSCAERA